MIRFMRLLQSRGLADDLPHDLVRTGKNRGDPDIPPGAGDGMLFTVPVPAMDGIFRSD